MTRLRTIALQMGVGLGILVLLFLAAFAVEQSGTFAIHNPEVAHMRWPVVFLTITTLFAA